MALFVLPRAICAARRHGIRGEALPLNIRSAVRAYAEDSARQAHTRGFHFTQLVHMPVDECRSDIRQLAGDRFVAGVMHDACKIAIVLLVRFEQQAPDLPMQFRRALLQITIELRDLRWLEMFHVPSGISPKFMLPS